MVEPFDGGGGNRTRATFPPKVVRFTVHGVPAPQGSKNPYGGESNPRTKPWRAAVAAAAAEAIGDGPLLLGPIMLRAVFYFPRPASHYGTGRNSGFVKALAPRRKASTPDLDKLLRAVGDALTGIVLRDDAQIAGVFAYKMYAERGSVEIAVEQLAA